MIVTNNNNQNDKKSENIEESLENENNSKDESTSKEKGFWQRKDNKGKKVAVVLSTIFFITALFATVYFMTKLSLLKTNDDENEQITNAKDVIYEEIDFEKMNDITDAKSLNDLIKNWATNDGEKMSSKNVLNVMLLGIDSESNLSDSIILLSLNKKTQKINIVSFYRDTYIYIQPESKKPRFAKLNSAYSSGGAKCTVKTIENNYKIKIDEYALVDYDTFPKIINALGGVTVNIKENEAKQLNKEFGYNLKSGKTKLNGEEALCYSRIRYSDADADVSRTRRQRTVLTSLLDSINNASISEIDKLINTLFPNIKTSMSKTQIVSLSTQALTKGWLSFDVVQQDMPSSNTRKGGRLPCGDVWITDFSGSANELQILLYGRSNIELPKKRISAIDIKPPTTTVKTTVSTTQTLPNEDDFEVLSTQSSQEITVSTSDIYSSTIKSQFN